MGQEDNGELEDAPVQPQEDDGELEALESAHESPLDFLCESPCVVKGESHSCRQRVQWLVKEEGSAVADAMDIVSQECFGQCMCSPLDFHCESLCMINGVTHSCRDRVQWLVREEGSTVADALGTVSHECGGQCMCSGADFGVEEDLSTTAMLVTSPEPSHLGSTTSKF